MKSQPYVLVLSPRPELVYSLFPSVSSTHFLCFVRYLTLTSPRHTLVSLLTRSYLSSVFLPVSPVVFTLLLIVLSPFSFLLCLTHIQYYLLVSCSSSLLLAPWQLLPQLQSSFTDPFLSFGINSRDLRADNWRTVTSFNQVRISPVGFSS